MPGYTITFARSARKELQALPIDVAERLLKKIELLTVNARPAGSKKLSGATDLFRIRVGDYILAASPFPSICSFVLAWSDPSP
jgi:mRNA-degrading endonuclease RelE of RelBE toxin-antitoxin system